MHFRLMLLVSLTCLLGSVISTPTPSSSSSANVAAATTAKPQGFSARSIEASDEEDEFETQAQTHLAYRQQQQQQQQQQRALYDYSQSEEDQEPEPPRQQYYQQQQQQQTNRNNVKQQSNYLKLNKRPISEEESEEEEIEEPDRLSTLLAKSTFNCNSKTTGYYADESLNCEIFHYCQDNQRHSWICPEGFTFHQIHLICMPPSNENICKQSSKYHIVNDYLYKPINLQEHQSKPNVTLRYSERYYPESYYEHEQYEDSEEELPRQRVQHHRQPVQVGFQQSQQQAQPQYRSQPTPQQQIVRHQPQQTTTVYRPKPTPIATTIPPQLPQLQPQHQQIIHHQRPQTLSPIATPTPHTYRYFTSAPLQQQQSAQVYRTPEEINISLQQRRPQLFVATSTPRYYEDEYLYERRK